MNNDDLRALAAEHRLCGPKYEGCYSHFPMPHCRACGMSVPCDVERMAPLLDRLAALEAVRVAAEAIRDSQLIHDTAYEDVVDPLCDALYAAREATR